MAATFRTRPWLLAATRPSFAPSLCAARGTRANIEQTRGYAIKIPRTARQAADQATKEHRKAPASSSAVKEYEKAAAQNAAAIATLAPRTLVRMPISKVPREPKKFLKYHWEILKQRLVDRAQIFAHTLATKPTWFKKTQMRAGRGDIIPAARNLHASMSYCLAKGGRDEKIQLAQICVPKLHRSLVLAIERRPKGKSYRWERVSETGWPLWPRIMDHKWMEVNVGVKMSFRQAVVGIKSKQRLVELDAKGNEVSKKEMELLEYIVLWRRVDRDNLTQDDWQLYGTLKETSFEDVMKELKEVNALNQIEAQKKLAQEEKKIV